MAQYTSCKDIEEFEDHWQGSSQGPVVPLFFNAMTQAFIHMFIAAGAGALLGLPFGGIGAAVGAVLGAQIGFSYGFVEGFCDQWLNWRLICVQRNTCAIGRVAWIETVGAKFGHDPIEWLFDNDLSFNLRLVPYSGKVQRGADWKVEFPRDDSSVTYGLGKISADPFESSKMLRKPRKADGSEWSLDYKGYEGDGKPDHPGGRWTLHSEIEGNGMQMLCTIAKVLSILGPLTTAVGVVAGAVGGAVVGAYEGYKIVHDWCDGWCKVPVLCDVSCFVMGVIGGIIGGILGAIVGAIAGAIPGLGQIIIGSLISTVFRHNGDFSDVADDPESGRIEDEDCVIITGDQVYDAGHSDGWVEMHPVRRLHKICSHESFLAPGEQFDPDCCPSAATGSPKFTDPAFKAEVTAFWDRWCTAVGQAADPLTVTAQGDPVNMWCTHPLLDGCKPDDPPPAGPH